MVFRSVSILSLILVLGVAAHASGQFHAVESTRHTLAGFLPLLMGLGFVFARKRA